VRNIPGTLNFLKSTDPHEFLNVDLVLHRFLKTEKQNHLLVDILVGRCDEFNKVFDNVSHAEWEKGNVSIANKSDLIRLKKLRNSGQDIVDMKKLKMTTKKTKIEQVIEELGQL